MEYAKTEVLVLEKTEIEAFEKSVQDLTDLHLAMVGGGVGEVLFG